MQEVVAGLSGKADKLYAEGLHVGGERYVLTKAEDRSLYARKVKLIFSFGTRSMTGLGASRDKVLRKKQC
jgi:hypothetical protein